MKVSPVINLASLLTASASALIAAPVVTNVVGSQRDDGTKLVDIAYDLMGGQGPMTVSFRVSENNGATYIITPREQYVSGDAGPGILNGTGKQIVWDAAQDVPHIYWPQARIRVIASEEPSPVVGVPLTIASTIAPGSISQSASQTLTFTFDEPVIGFDATDIAVTGGTKGDFTALSTAIYTLAVTGSGGTCSVSVPAGVASAATGSQGGNAAAVPHSYFYQDTWQVVLATVPSEVTMDLIRIPAGQFVMGSPTDELSRGGDELQHEVTITRDFYLGMTEVTQDQWVALRPFPQPQAYIGGSMPVHNVSWSDAQSWIAQLHNTMPSATEVKLPTEAQWEYACRAGRSTRFSYGSGMGLDDLCAVETDRVSNMWYCGNNTPPGTKAVGINRINPWGLFDMHGNVWEWCEDRYGSYPTEAVIDPVGSTTGLLRVRRGGGWGSLTKSCRAAARNSLDPSDSFNNIGFRVLATR